MGAVRRDGRRWIAPPRQPRSHRLRGAKLRRTGYRLPPDRRRDGGRLAISPLVAVVGRKYLLPAATRAPDPRLHVGVPVLHPRPSRAHRARRRGVAGRLLPDRDGGEDPAARLPSDRDPDPVRGPCRGRVEGVAGRGSTRTLDRVTAEPDAREGAVPAVSMVGSKV